MPSAQKLLPFLPEFLFVALILCAFAGNTYNETYEFRPNLVARKEFHLHARRLK
jgi:hypothetical protein